MLALPVRAPTAGPEAGGHRRLVRERLVPNVDDHVGIVRRVPRDRRVRRPKALRLRNGDLQLARVPPLLLSRPLLQGVDRTGLGVRREHPRGLDVQEAGNLAAIHLVLVPRVGSGALIRRDKLQHESLRSVGHLFESGQRTLAQVVVVARGIFVVNLEHNLLLHTEDVQELRIGRVLLWVRHSHVQLDRPAEIRRNALDVHVERGIAPQSLTQQGIGQQARHELLFRERHLDLRNLAVEFHIHLQLLSFEFSALVHAILCVQTQAVATAEEPNQEYLALPGKGVLDLQRVQTDVAVHLTEARLGVGMHRWRHVHGAVVQPAGEEADASRALSHIRLMGHDQLVLHIHVLETSFKNFLLQPGDGLELPQLVAVPWSVHQNRLEDPGNCSGATEDLVRQQCRLAVRETVQAPLQNTLRHEPASGQRNRVGRVLFHTTHFWPHRKLLDGELLPDPPIPSPPFFLIKAVVVAHGTMMQVAEGVAPHRLRELDVFPVGIAEEQVRCHVGEMLPVRPGVPTGDLHLLAGLGVCHDGHLGVQVLNSLELLELDGIERDPELAHRRIRFR
mmetsp:Transcript_92038/g.264846  ORF Transcript_92038/g.264846 Transcript_92038/m.264846 type:complete len:562 (-) Transcript_92038:1099-2784(-)